MTGRSGHLAELKDERIAERPYHSNLCTSEFDQNSVKIQQNYHKFSEILTNLRTSQYFLECSASWNRSAKFREKIIKIGAKFDEHCRKIKTFAEIRTKIRKTFEEFLRIF